MTLDSLVALDQQPNTAAGEDAGHAQLIAVRRLDWRFLLPDPTLGRVAYIGPEQGALLEALRTFSDELIVLDASSLGATDTPYDRVVCKGVSPALLASVVVLLRPGGAVYAEVSGRWVHPGAYRRAALRAGLIGVQAHWHWPNFASCTRMVPLDDAGAVSSAWLKGASGVKGMLAHLTALGLFYSRLLGWGIRHFSLTGQRV